MGLVEKIINVIKIKNQFEMDKTEKDGLVRVGEKLLLYTNHVDVIESANS